MMAKIIDMETRDMVERRAKIRRRVLKAASLTFFGGYCTRESIARNLCQNGARLDFEDTTGVPHEFTLMINGEAASRTARIRWCTATSVGVQFMEKAETVVSA
jgi:hypothetical protein